MGKLAAASLLQVKANHELNIASSFHLQCWELKKGEIGFQEGWRCRMQRACTHQGFSVAQICSAKIYLSERIYYFYFRLLGFNIKLWMMRLKLFFVYFTLYLLSQWSWLHPGPSTRWTLQSDPFTLRTYSTVPRTLHRNPFLGALGFMLDLSP